LKVGRRGIVPVLQAEEDALRFELELLAVDGVEAFDIDELGIDLPRPGIEPRLYGVAR
jgi:hypothetical protein